MIEDDETGFRVNCVDNHGKPYTLYCSQASVDELEAEFDSLCRRYDLAFATMIMIRRGEVETFVPTPPSMGPARVFPRTLTDEVDLCFSRALGEYGKLNLRRSQHDVAMPTLYFLNETLKGQYGESITNYYAASLFRRWRYSDNAATPAKVYRVASGRHPSTGNLSTKHGIDHIHVYDDRNQVTVVIAETKTTGKEPYEIIRLSKTAIDNILTKDRQHQMTYSWLIRRIWILHDALSDDDSEDAMKERAWLDYVASSLSDAGSPVNASWSLGRLFLRMRNQLFMTTKLRSYSPIVHIKYQLWIHCIHNRITVIKEISYRADGSIQRYDHHHLFSHRRFSEKRKKALIQKGFIVSR
ncbi:hypothetical protein [Inquilinus sp. OTU3971]|uniref:hypothetical protein n=1 Tax=Inquilinus sp. OTU3971 TaxID=3043855 RepID=UPI00313F05CD